MEKDIAVIDSESYKEVLSPFSPLCNYILGRERSENEFVSGLMTEKVNRSIMK